MSQYVKFFNEITIKDVPIVGGNNASLGEMYQKLTKSGVRIPNGFATTADAYYYFLKTSGVQKKLEGILAGLDTHNIPDLARRGKLARGAILKAELPKDLQKEIILAYRRLSGFYKTKNLSVAVRSSATAEDLPDASFAGQQETYLNVSGEANVLMAVKKCIASLFTDRAISYRVDKNFDHFSIALSVGIQKMIRSDLGSSGIMFTIDTETGFSNVVIIDSIYGLGENIVQGRVNPDEFYVFKPTLAIIDKTLGEKKIKMVYDLKTKATSRVKNIPVPKKDQFKFSISDDQVKTLARWGMIVEKHYKKPMDMEWALDGQDGQLYMVQARPETVNSQRDYNILEEYTIKKRGKVLVEGRSVGSRVGTGIVNRIINVKDINKFKPGQILVTAMTDPDWEPIMKMAAAIITDKGGRTCHAAIVSRELGIPCIVGADNATKKLSTGQTVTVSCAEGDVGFVYEGKIPFSIKKTNVQKIPRPDCKIMLNVGSPDIAFANSFLPNDGVGLAREEFIVNDYIRIHPLALVNYHKIKDPQLKKQIDELTIGYSDKKQFFIDKLAQGVGTIAAAFYPKDVIVRLSDFKTNEYANLIGGQDYEPVESNPMIGWRGASRYYDPKFEPAFALECLALKKVREEFGLKNLKIMVPFCRTIEEGKLVIKTMAKYGLKQGRDGLEIYVMAEIPTNILLANDFAKVFDGFSIGSNDLTQLTLCIDRDAGNLQIAGQSNENNPSVKSLIQFLIEVGHRTHTKVGICGQAPSDFPEFAKFLLACGIDSISLNPDTVLKTTIALAKFKPRKRE